MNFKGKISKRYYQDKYLNLKEYQNIPYQDMSKLKYHVKIYQQFSEDYLRKRQFKINLILDLTISLFDNFWQHIIKPNLNLPKSFKEPTISFKIQNTCFSINTCLSINSPWIWKFPLRAPVNNLNKHKSIQIILTGKNKLVHHQRSNIKQNKN